MSNNPPEVVLKISRELAEFIVENCDSNIVFGLNAIQHMDLPRPKVEQLVANMEQFKALRAAAKAGLEDQL